MSAREALHSAAHAALADVGGLAGAFDAPPVRASVPYAVVEEAELTDWSAKAMTGAEARLAIALHDEGERPLRLRAVQAAAEAAIAALPADAGGGWRIVTVTLVRSRIATDRPGRWMALSEFRVRMMEEL